MTLPDEIRDREYRKFVDLGGEVAVRTTATLVAEDIEIGAVEIKNATDDTRAVVKNDGTNNALVVVQNTVPTTTVIATNLDIRDLTSVSDSVSAVQSGTWNINNVSGTISLPTGASTSANQQPASTTVNAYNITLTNANTEYSQLLTTGTKEMRFRCRTLFDIRYAWVTGKVATPTAPYFTLFAGMEYYISEANFTSKTLYLASSTAGVVVEVEEWS